MTMPTNPLRRSRPILFSPFPNLAIAAALMALAACSPEPDSPSAPASTNAQLVTLTAAQLPHVGLYTVGDTTFHKSVEAAGVVDFDNDQATSVLAPFSGPVSRLLVQPGQRVAQGQALASVDSADFSAAIGAYGKALITARNARRIADTDKDLAAHNGISQREAEQAQTDAVSDEADRDAAREALVALNIDPGVIREIQAGRAPARAQGQIRSPIAGTVVEKLITPGQLLQAGTTPAFTVANLSKVWVMAQISASDLASIQIGDAAQVEASDGQPAMSGVVDNVSAVVNPDTRAVVARIAVANPGGVLKKQMYVRVAIHSRQAGAGIRAPVSAILRDDENLPFVYVAQAGGAFARRHVTLGYRDGDQYIVSEGLKPGERVVSAGGLFLQSMQSQ
jgi:cobalt-zinc-cadmium efflux system membrane fusion protein